MKSVAQVQQIGHDLPMKHATATVRVVMRPRLVQTWTIANALRPQAAALSLGASLVLQMRLYWRTSQAFLIEICLGTSLEDQSTSVS